MIFLKEKKDCCGCQACQQKCPQQCIKFSEESVKEALNKDSFNYTPDYNAIDPIIKEQVQLSVDFLRKALMLHNI